MHAKTKAMLDRAAAARRCAVGGFAQEAAALRTVINQATIEAMEVLQAFGDAEDAADSQEIAPLYEYQQKFGALKREVAKLQEQLDNVRGIQREISELDARVGESLRLTT